MKIPFIVTTLALTLGLIGYKATKYIDFNQNCKGYLERAGNANTVETAKNELNKATSWCEKNNRAEGYTTVLWQTPDQDISFWFNNLKAAHDELDTLPEDSTPLERTNVLLKLRETLNHHGEGGENVTYPDHLDIYPNQKLFMFLLVICVACWVRVMIWFM